MMTIRRIGFLVSAALALALPAAAGAQYGMSAPAPPQSVPNQGPPAHPSADREVEAPATAPELLAAAACVIGRNAAAGDPLFATVPFTAGERQQAVRLLNDLKRCAHHPGMTSSAILIRGALAEAAVEARFATPQPARSPEVAMAPLLRVDLATTIHDAASLAPAYALAECTARQHPELVRALLATEAASDAAGAAFTALNPAFVACVTPGAQLNVDARTLRGLLAEDLYRWSVVQRDGPASPWAAAPAPPPAPASH
jgi:hypothetical protein